MSDSINNDRVFLVSFYFFFFFNDTATTEIYTYYTRFPYTTLFRSAGEIASVKARVAGQDGGSRRLRMPADEEIGEDGFCRSGLPPGTMNLKRPPGLECAFVGQRLNHDQHGGQDGRSEEHTSELQSLMRISYAVFCLKKKKRANTYTQYQSTQKKY